MSDQAKKIDSRPFYWALATLGIVVAVWLGFRFFGEQRYYNTAWWQARRPVVRISEPQTATPVEVRDEWRNSLTVVQTEKGLYFLSGTKYIPSAGTQVVVQANDHWDIYMCAANGQRCMPIHSFCANTVWPNVKRDEKGRAEGCYAPYLGPKTAAELETPPPPPKPRGGPGKKQKDLDPPVGMSHPSEWASLMGLPAQITPAAK